jgi:hypothetical protein
MDLAVGLDNLDSAEVTHGRNPQIHKSTNPQNKTKPNKIPTMKKQQINDPAYLAIMLAEIHKKAEKVPEGYYTSKQWSERWNGRGKPDKILKIGIQAGIIERRDFRITIGDGRVLPIAHYKFLGEEKKKQNFKKFNSKKSKKSNSK